MASLNVDTISMEMPLCKGEDKKQTDVLDEMAHAFLSNIFVYISICPHKGIHQSSEFVKMEKISLHNNWFHHYIIHYNTHYLLE